MGVAEQVLLKSKIDFFIMKMHECYALRILDDDGFCSMLSENHNIYAGDQLHPYVVPRLKIKYQTTHYIKCEARREQTVRPDQFNSLISI